MLMGYLVVTAVLVVTFGRMGDMWVFFTLMILGLSASLPASMSSGLRANGVAPATAERIAHLPPSAACSPPSWATTPWRSCWAARARPG